MSWREQMVDRMERFFDPEYHRPPADFPGDRVPDEFPRDWAVSRVEMALDRFRAKVPPRFRDATPEVLSGRCAQAFEEWREAGGTSNVLFFGPVGTGKSFAAYSFLAHVEVCGVWRWRAISTVKLMDDLRPSSDGANQSLKDYAKADILLLDDLGGEKPSEWVSERLFALFDERWQWERPTLVTTNLLPDQLRTVLGDRTYSRLQDGAVAVTLAGGDRRRDAA